MYDKKKILSTDKHGSQDIGDNQLCSANNNRIVCNHYYVNDAEYTRSSYGNTDVAGNRGRIIPAGNCWENIFLKNRIETGTGTATQADTSIAPFNRTIVRRSPGRRSANAGTTDVPGPAAEISTVADGTSTTETTTAAGRRGLDGRVCTDIKNLAENGKWPTPYR
jgi:hypothetical protein